MRYRKGFQLKPLLRLLLKAFHEQDHVQFQLVIQQLHPQSFFQQ